MLWFSVARGPPLNLAKDLEQLDLEALWQAEPPAESTSKKVYDLVMACYHTEKIRDGLKLLQAITWTSASAERQHGSSVVVQIPSFLPAGPSADQRSLQAHRVWSRSMLSTFSPSLRSRRITLQSKQSQPPTLEARRWTPCSPDCCQVGSQDRLNDAGLAALLITDHYKQASEQDGARNSGSPSRGDHESGSGGSRGVCQTAGLTNLQSTESSLQRVEMRMLGGGLAPWCLGRA